MGAAREMFLRHNLYPITFIFKTLQWFPPELGIKPKHFTPWLKSTPDLAPASSSSLSPLTTMLQPPGALFCSQTCPAPFQSLALFSCCGLRTTQGHERDAGYNTSSYDRSTIITIHLQHFLSFQAETLYSLKSNSSFYQDGAF